MFLAFGNGLSALGNSILVLQLVLQRLVALVPKAETYLEGFAIAICSARLLIN